jgi:hypothetical protein
MASEFDVAQLIRQISASAAAQTGIEATSRVRHVFGCLAYKTLLGLDEVRSRQSSRDSWAAVAYLLSIGGRCQFLTLRSRIAAVSMRECWRRCVLQQTQPLLIRDTAYKI